VLLLTLSNPPLRNAMAPHLYPLARDAFRDAAADPGIGAIVLDGRGQALLRRWKPQTAPRAARPPRASQAQVLDALHDGWRRCVRAPSR
jgi:enoyl-CoA hydratase/carnithine racemase